MKKFFCAIIVINLSAVLAHAQGELVTLSRDSVKLLSRQFVDYFSQVAYGDPGEVRYWEDGTREYAISHWGDCYTFILRLDTAGASCDTYHFSVVDLPCEGEVDSTGYWFELVYVATDAQSPNECGPEPYVHTGLFPYPSHLSDTVELLEGTGESDPMVILKDLREYVSILAYWAE